MRGSQRFSFNLAVRRTARLKGLNMAQLAKRINIHSSTLRDTLKADAPTMQTCERYADALGVSLILLIQKGYVR